MTTAVGHIDDDALHAGLLLIGATPGHPARFEPDPGWLGAPFMVMPRKASMLCKSISTEGSDSRIFSVASSVCPPAKSRASSP